MLLFFCKTCLVCDPVHFNTKCTIPVTFEDIAVMTETGIFTSESLKDDRISMVKLLVK